MALSRTGKARWKNFAAATLLPGCASCGWLGSDSDPWATVRDTRTAFTDGPGIEVCWSGVRVVAPSQAPGGAMAICISSGRTGASCNTTSACAPGERCVCGRCVTKPCRNATGCGQHEVCQGGRCTAICASNADCSPQEECNTGGCARRCAADADCAYGEQCSGLDRMCIVKLCGATVSCSGTDTCMEQERVADLREPQILDEAGRRVAYLELRETQGATTSCAVYRARVVAERRWEIEPVVPVLASEGDDKGCIGAPSVVAAERGRVMYAARGDGSGIVRATSTDGIAFSRSDGMVRVPTAPWERGWVGSPGAIRFGGKTVLLYAAARGEAIGRVFVDEQAGDVTKPLERAWLVPGDLEDPMFWRSVRWVGSPFPVERDGTVLVYLGVRGAEGSDAQIAAGGQYAADVNASIGLVTTRDFATWQRFPTGPVFSRRTNLRAYLGEGEPSVVFDGIGSWLVYVGADALGAATTGLGLATCEQK